MTTKLTSKHWSDFDLQIWDTSICQYHVVHYPASDPAKELLHLLLFPDSAIFPHGGKLLNPDALFDFSKGYQSFIAPLLPQEEMDYGPLAIVHFLHHCMIRRPHLWDVVPQTSTCWTILALLWPQQHNCNEVQRQTIT